MQNLIIADTILPGRRYPIRRVQTINNEPSVTKQHFAKFQDIRYIINQFIKTGQGFDYKPNPIYGDFTRANAEGYLNSLNTVAQVNAQFEELTLKQRERFNNKAINYLDFMADPANIEESIKLGLRPKPVEQAKDKTDYVTPVAKSPVVPPAQ